jgi:hypothetical protein
MASALGYAAKSEAIAVRSPSGHFAIAVLSGGRFSLPRGPHGGFLPRALWVASNGSSEHGSHRGRLAAFEAARLGPSLASNRRRNHSSIDHLPGPRQSSTSSIAAHWMCVGHASG